MGLSLSLFSLLVVVRAFPEHFTWLKCVCDLFRDHYAEENAPKKTMCGREPNALEEFLLEKQDLTPEQITIFRLSNGIPAHFMDWYSDINYIFTVAMYSTWIKVFLIISLIIPMLLVTLAVIIGK